MLLTEIIHHPGEEWPYPRNTYLLDSPNTGPSYLYLPLCNTVNQTHEFSHFQEGLGKPISTCVLPRTEAVLSFLVQVVIWELIPGSISEKEVIRTDRKSIKCSLLSWWLLWVMGLCLTETSKEPHKIHLGPIPVRMRLSIYPLASSLRKLWSSLGTLTTTPSSTTLSHHTPTLQLWVDWDTSLAWRRPWTKSREPF